MALYYTVMVIGAWWLVVAGSYNSFTGLLIGRMIVKIGIEMGSTSKSALLSKWYYGKE